MQLFSLALQLIYILAFIAVVGMIIFSPIIYVLFDYLLFKSNEKKTLKAMLVLFLSFSSIVVISVVIHRWQQRITEERAALLIEKIKAYKSTKGSYPPHLSQLVPDYLPEIPHTAEGGDFVYYDSIRLHPNKKGIPAEFTLKYYGSLMLIATYRSDAKHWDYDD